MGTKKKPEAQNLLIWTGPDQRRFVQAVDGLESAVKELTAIVRELQAERLQRPRERPREPLASDGTAAGNASETG